MKRAFWILVAGAVFSALMAAGIGRADDDREQINIVAEDQ